MAKRKGGRKVNLAGTNLCVDPRTGNYIWRKKHERTGKRIVRSTRTSNIKTAVARAQKFEEEYEREMAGLSRFEGYRRPVQAFLKDFLTDSGRSENRAIQLEHNLARAFRLLGVKTLADLENFNKVEQKLLRLEGDGPDRFSRTTLVRAFQQPFKQFTRYLAGRRHLPVDHLAAWPILKADGPKFKRRAFHGDEMARALAAADCLDEICCRNFPSRPVWSALLITGARITAFSRLDVIDLDRDSKRPRVRLKGNARKPAGAGALDKTTFAETHEYVGNRESGPLFLSPNGLRLDRYSALDNWRAALSLAFVDLEWPDMCPRDIRLAYLVSLALQTGKVRVAMGGPLTGKHKPGDLKAAERQSLERKVTDLADQISEKWQERMDGPYGRVDVHALRMTHRTWALRQGVPEILVDRQIGHTSTAAKALEAAWSSIGRAHYTDFRMLTLDAGKSAEAVRATLDEAVSELQADINAGRSVLGKPSQRGRLGIA